MIQNEQVTATWAVKATIDEMTKPLVSSKDALFRERAADFEDVSLQIIRVLQGQPQHGLSHLDRDVILVADKLLPSELFSIDKTHVLGIALDGGGSTSHIAILTRSLRIPTVLALGSFSSKVHSGDEVIVDGNYGEVFVRPELSTRQMVKERNERMEREHHQLDELSKLPTVTQDGHAMVILSNIEMVREVPLVKQVGSDGIGLYRSEYLIIEGGEKISEDVQFENYKSVIQAMAPQPVTIRTFDIGGDKVVPAWALTSRTPFWGGGPSASVLHERTFFRYSYARCSAPVCLENSGSCSR
jgi:phosphotransferase system enzyme I (PtsI)